MDIEKTVSDRNFLSMMQSVVDLALKSAVTPDEYKLLSDFQLECVKVLD